MKTVEPFFLKCFLQKLSWTTLRKLSATMSDLSQPTEITFHNSDFLEMANSLRKTIFNKRNPC